MSHPDLDRLTSWVHGLLESDEVEAHVAGCPECRGTADALREEARILSHEMGSPERLAVLKAGLLHAAAPRRSVRGLLWQVPVAAAVLFGLVAVLLSPGSRHQLTGGRVALEDGRVVEAPIELAASQPWLLRSLETASVRLSDRSTVDLGPGARVSLAPNGARGVQASVFSGRASFTVAHDPKRLTVCSPAGRVEATDGRFEMKIVVDEEGGIPVKNALAGAIVTVFAGSISLSNANGTVEARPGQSAVLAVAEAPLFLAAPQDKQEELLRRLEQLAARVAKLEDEVAQLEKKNAQLKTQLTSSAPGAIWSTNGAGGGFRMFQSGTPGATVIIEEKSEKKSDPNTPERK